MVTVLVLIGVTIYSWVENPLNVPARNMIIPAWEP